jgi:hypothetical protein
LLYLHLYRRGVPAKLKEIFLATLMSSLFHKSIFSKVNRIVGPLILMAVDTSPSAPIIGAAIHLIPGVHSSSSKAIPSILIFSKSCLNSEIFKP